MRRQRHPLRDGREQQRQQDHSRLVQRGAVVRQALHAALLPFPRAAPPGQDRLAQLSYAPTLPIQWQSTLSGPALSPWSGFLHRACGQRSDPPEQPPPFPTERALPLSPLDTPSLCRGTAPLPPAYAPRQRLPVCPPPTPPP